MGKFFLDKQYIKEVLSPFYVVAYHYKMGQGFLDIQYIYVCIFYILLLTRLLGHSV